VPSSSSKYNLLAELELFELRVKTSLLCWSVLGWLTSVTIRSRKDLLSLYFDLLLNLFSLICSSHLSFLCHQVALYAPRTWGKSVSRCSNTSMNLEALVKIIFYKSIYNSVSLATWIVSHLQPLRLQFRVSIHFDGDRS